jgi:hypothetical protein
MPVTVKVNGAANSLVHKGSNGTSIATIPDVCKTPTPSGPVPMPYPNISQSATLSNGTTTVKADGMMIAVKGSEFSLSNGDQAGTVGGVKSGVFMKESTWILYSFDVKMDGKNACRLTDKKFHNHENTVNIAGVLQQPVAVQLGLDPDEKAVADELCSAFCDKLKEGHKKGPKGGWSKKASYSKTHQWSNELEKDLLSSPPAKCSALKVIFRGVFGGGKTKPDAVLEFAGKVKRCFDFKFPKDRWRDKQRYRQKKLAGNKEPVKINAKNCACS